MNTTPLTYLYSTNQPSNGKNSSKKPEESSTSQQKIISYKSINENQSSVQLMIRAHERIRSLQQDNQILRQHVELLTKDNRQVIEKLGKVRNQKAEIIKTNQELKMQLRELEVRLGKYQVREQLENFQKQNKCKQKQHQQYNHKLQCSHEIPKINNKNCQQNKKSAFEKDKNIEQVSPTKQKCHSLSYHEPSINNVNKLLQQCSKVSKNQSCYQFKGRSQQHGDKSSSLDKNQPYSINYSSCKDQNLKNFFNYKYVSNNQTKNLRQKVEFPLNNSLIGGRYEQIRSISPLIRKNSPKRSKPSCQFHSKTIGISSMMTQSISQSRLGRKYNYTNWRKANNNLTVWRFANTTQHRPITIQR